MSSIKKLAAALLLATCLSTSSYSQDLTWYDPVATPTIYPEGQGWPGDTSHFYSRLPVKAGASVRKDVYELSQNNAGLILNFSTNATEITIQYGLKESLQFPHMPATGVSGIDLYAIDNKRNWHRVTGKYRFSDTIQFTYSTIRAASDQTFKLYLPLYNSVSWLRIGIGKGFSYSPVNTTHARPILVYGTSIAQGACASRPGMAWTAILGRSLQLPVINLGFSGNGRLEPEVLDYINEIDARIFVLDCLPNIADRSYDELKELLTAAVQQIRKQHPATPIMLTEHLGFGDESTNMARAATVEKANKALQDAYRLMLKNGVKGIYTLSKNELALNEDSFVDNIHPNDAGMLQYAAAYKRAIEKIGVKAAK